MQNQDSLTFDVISHSTLIDLLLHCSYAAENSRTESKIYSGDIYDSVSGQGFLCKRKRSFIPRQTEQSYTRASRRYRQILHFDNLVSD